MADSEKGPGVCEFDPDALQLKLRTTLAGRTEEIQPVVRQIMGFLKEIGCAEGDAYEIELSVSEALANAVLHGCQGDPEKRIAVCVECDPDRGMLIVVQDPGQGFDPSSVPSPVEGERIRA
ncbi:MAG: ATP-binding protein [Acidobacteriota bacterium]